MDKRSFILGMITAFCECVAGGCKRMALSPPFRQADSEMVRVDGRSVWITVLVLVMSVLLVGCVPKMYSDDQEKALTQACRPAVEEFLASRYGEYELIELHLQKGLIEKEKPLFGNYGSHVVRGSYTVDGNTWELVYDSETGRFYTNELRNLLMEQEAARMLEYLSAEVPEEDLHAFRLTELDFYYVVQSHDIQAGRDEKADTYVYINSVLPAEITAQDLPAFAEGGFDGGIVNMIHCHYSSERADALTDEAFQRFFDDNPAYQVGNYLIIENDYSSAGD